MFTNEDKDVIKFVQENKRVNLEEIKRFVACNIGLSDRTVNAFHFTVAV